MAAAQTTPLSTRRIGAGRYELLEGSYIVGHAEYDDGSWLVDAAGLERRFPTLFEALDWAGAIAAAWRA